MYRDHHWPEDEAADRQTTSLAAIVIVLVLLISGLFIVEQLQAASSLQDCLMAGRQNCHVVVAGRR